MEEAGSALPTPPPAWPLPSQLPVVPTPCPLLIKRSSTLWLCSSMTCFSSSCLLRSFSSESHHFPFFPGSPTELQTPSVAAQSRPFLPAGGLLLQSGRHRGDTAGLFLGPCSVSRDEFSARLPGEHGGGTELCPHLFRSSLVAVRTALLPASAVPRIHGTGARLSAARAAGSRGGDPGPCPLLALRPRLLRSWVPAPVSPGVASEDTGGTGSASSPEASISRPSPGKVSSLHCVTHSPLCPCALTPLRPFLRFRQAQEGEERNTRDLSL